VERWEVAFGEILFEEVSPGWVEGFNAFFALGKSCACKGEDREQLLEKHDEVVAVWRSSIEGQMKFIIYYEGPWRS
jgi:hypothetical protein